MIPRKPGLDKIILTNYQIRGRINSSEASCNDGEMQEGF